ncbi:hypothetical protein OKW43_003392 [Paraburkholderia sp. WC7.3g]|uniref:hypothetical protein n=1 Tax=Paraburkholderia sp. WC7.3g TaxID=2991070 RepID=UPI003D25EC80
MKKTFPVLFAFVTSTSVLAQSNLPQQLPKQQLASARQPATKQLSQGGPQLPAQASMQVPTQLPK